MKDFNRYQAEKAKEAENTEKTERSEETLNEEEKEAVELTRRAFSAYNGKSDTAMLAEILQQAERSRREGKLTDEEIDAFFAQFSPLLAEGQRKKLRSVLAQLKKI